MEIHPNARKRGYTDDDLLHAIRNAMRVIKHQVSPDRDLVIGVLPNGSSLLEIVIEDPDTDEAIVIHAMPLRPKFYTYL